MKKFNRIVRERRTVSVESVIAIFVFVVAVGIYFYRIFFGAEITDECFSISEVFITVQGAVPIVDTWSQSPMFVILVYPFIKLFLILSGGSTEGIILYGRCLFFAFKLLVVVIFVLFLKKEIRCLFLMVAAAIYMEHGQGFNIFTFTYGSGSVVFLILSSIFLALAFSGIQENLNDKKILYYAVLAGFCACACAIAHPSQIIYCIAMFVILVLIECKMRIKHRISFSFAAAGSLLASIVFCLLLLKKGVAEFVNGLDMVLNKNPYFILKENSSSVGESVLQQLSQIWQVLQCNIFLTASIAFFGVIGYVFFCFGGKNMQKHNITHKVIVDIILVSYWCVYIYLFFRKTYLYNDLSVSEQFLTLPAVFILPFYISYIKDIPIRLKWFCIFIETASCCWILNAGVLAYGGYSSRCYACIGVTVAYILLSMYYFSVIFADFKKYILSIAFVCSFCLLFLGITQNLYGYTYREDSFKNLNVKIRSGVYKGLYTTKERAEGLLQTENTIRMITDETDRVLFMEVVPFAYLMTEAKACAPSTWDISLYSYGFNEDIQYRSYFAAADCEPDKIIYIDTGRDDHLSIDEPGYYFNEFVNENYILTIRVDDAYYPIRMYERILKK